MAARKTKIGKNDFNYANVKYLRDRQRIGPFRIWLYGGMYATVEAYDLMWISEKGTSVWGWGAEISCESLFPRKKPAYKERAEAKKELANMLNVDIEELRKKAEKAYKAKEDEMAKELAAREKETKRHYSGVKSMRLDDLKLEDVEEVYRGFLLDAGNGRLIRVQVKHKADPDRWYAYIYDTEVKDPSGEGQKLIEVLGGAKSAKSIVRWTNLAAKAMREEAEGERHEDGRQIRIGARA